MVVLGGLLSHLNMHTTALSLQAPGTSKDGLNLMMQANYLGHFYMVKVSRRPLHPLALGLTRVRVAHFVTPWALYCAAAVGHLG